MLHTHFFPTRFANAFAVMAVLMALLIAAVGTQVVTPAFAANTTYYVDCAAGNDSNNGTSTSTPWRTMARASQQTYGAGDSILFKRGTTCSGTGFKPVGNGTTASPITIADYGSGNLPILDGVGVHEAAIQMYNTQNYVLRNLDLTQHGQTPITDPSVNRNFDDVTMQAALDIRGIQSGIDNINCGEPCTVRNITLDALKIHASTWKGINLGAGLYDLKSGPVYGYMDNVLIQNSEVWGNTMIGIDVYSTYTKQVSYHASNVTIRTSYLHDNGWDGIRMGPVDHGLIDSNECSYNGSLQDARLGCWGWDSHDLVMQFNESHHNMTPVMDRHARDGGGFDCDLGSEDCLMQYNWSHDNQGEGYLTLTWPIGFGFQRGVSHNIQMRYNIGERDGKKLAGAWYNFGGVENLFVYNNTLYYEPARVSIGGTQAFVCDAGAVACHDTWGAGGSTATNYVWNNIFITSPNPSGGPSWLQWTDGTGTWAYNNNIWYRTQGGFETSGCANFACWQALGRDLNGYNANPGLVGPLGGGPAAYHLTAGSVAIDHARNVTESLRGMGTRDYFGLAIPQGSAYDIGAAEFASGGGATATPVPPTNTPTRTNTPVPPTATNTPGGPTNTPVPPTNTPVPPTATRTNTPVPPTATPGGSVVMHVATLFTTDVNGTPTDVFLAGDHLYWRAQIKDAGGAPVSGASVTTTLTRANGSLFGPYTVVTDANGWAFFDQTTAKAWPKGTCSVQVTNVTKTGATYDSAANVGTPHSFTMN